MKLFFAAIVVFCASITNTISQNGICDYTMQGSVLDAETKEPLPYVSIKVKSVDKFAVTDINGDFTITGLCDEQNTLVISCYGYCDTVCEQYHQHGKASHIYLTQNVLELSEVVISVEESKEEGTASMSRITVKKEALSSNPTQSLAAVLSEIEGVTLTSTGTNVQLPVIHGLYGNRILILNNGLKHGFQNWGLDHAPEIDLSAAHSITVLKGAAGVRYGPEALGGVIIIEPNHLHLNEPFFGNIGSGYQTNGRGVFTNFEVGQGLKKWSYAFGGNYTKIGDRQAPDYSLTNSGKEEKAMNAGVRYRSNNWDFNLYYSFVDQNLALLRSSVAESSDAFKNAINSDRPYFIRPFSYSINEPNQLTQHHLSKVEINWWYNDEAKLTFRVGQQLNKREEYDVRRNADKPIIDLDLITSDYQLEWTHPHWNKLHGLVGLQIFTQNNDNNPGTGTTPFIPNYNTLRYSGFITENLHQGGNTFEAGLRVDYENNNVRGREPDKTIFRDDFSFTNFTASLGYIRRVSANSTFKTNIGTAWRTPNMAELYSFGQHGFKTSFGLLRYYTNESGEGGNLKTDQVLTIDESGVSPEKGYKWISEWTTEKRNNSFTLTAYSHYIQNFIFNRPVDVRGTIRGPMPVFIFDQADALFIGSDFTWKSNWSRHLSGVYSLSYIWSKNIEKIEPLINQPPITTSYKLTWQTPDFWKITSSQVSIKPTYAFRQFQAPRTVSVESITDGSTDLKPDSEIFDFADAPDGYFVLDLSWGFTANRFKGSITIQNILNEDYRDYLNELRYFADEQGRNFLFTINYNLNSKSN